MLKLDNFVLEEYNYTHNKIIEELQIDQNTKKYLGDLKFTISMIKKRNLENNIDKAYVAYYNNYPIGFITISYMDEKYQISYAILPEYRKQNLGSLLLQEFSEAIFQEYSNIDELILKIKEDNIGSQNVAELAGFEKSAKETFTQRKK